MKIKLVFPPAWQVSQPYLSIPSLVAYLKEKNIDVSQTDLNIQVFDRILSAEYLQLAREKIEQRFATYSANDQKRIGELENFYGYFVENLEQVKAQFRTKIDVDTYRTCRGFLEHCLEWWSLAHAPEVIRLGTYEPKYDHYVVEEVLESIANRTEHIFYPVFAECLTELVEGVGLIGISITGATQIIPSLILASMIKASYPQVKICLGGSIVTRWGSELTQHPQLFDYVDYVILYEGEEPLYQLIRSLEEGLELEEVPNLLFKDAEGVVVETASRHAFQVDQLPCPEFPVEQFAQYFWPEPVLPLLVSRGCYWGRCTFCDHSHIYQQQYSERNQQQIRADLRELVDRYGVRQINFHDEAISPDLLEELNLALEAEKMQVRWSCDARFDRHLSKELLERSANNGLRAFFFGLESMHPRVLKLIKKGITREEVARILQDSFECDIWNHLFFILGFPTETREEAEATIDFLKEQEAYIGSTGVSPFQLSKYSPVAQAPEKYQISIAEEQKELELRWDFTYQSGTDLDQVTELYDQLKNGFVGRFDQLQRQIFREHWVTLEEWPLEAEPTGRLALKPWIHFDQVDGQVRVIDLFQAKIITLTGDTWFLLEYLKQGLSLEEISAKLSIKYGVAEEMLQELVVNFIESLRKDELVG